MAVWNPTVEFLSEVKFSFTKFAPVIFPLLLQIECYREWKITFLLLLPDSHLASSNTLISIASYASLKVCFLLSNKIL